jgi:signal peptidase I
MADSTKESDKQQPSLEEESAQGRRDIVRALLICLAIVVFVRSFICEPFKIPSSSMVPTLRIGDHIFVSKFRYGLSLPFTKIQFLKWAEPKRGDVIVFLFPREESLYYVKRVVGVPGDRIELKGKDIYVNGVLFKKEPVTETGEILEATGAPEVSGELYREYIEERMHYALYRSTGVSDILRSGDPDTVPEAMYFVMGDNRDDSYDSRRWGYVPRENIKGRAEIIWLSLDKTLAPGFGKIRWERLFKAIR